MTALVLALAAGAVVGLALGALGGGGGMIAVPALVYLLGFAPVEAATASLVVVAVTAACALYGHARDGRVRWAAGLLFAAAGAGPAALAARLASGVPRPVLTAAFAVVAALAALRMLRPPAGALDEEGDGALGKGGGRGGGEDGGGGGGGGGAGAAGYGRTGPVEGGFGDRGPGGGPEPGPHGGGRAPDEGGGPEPYGTPESADRGPEGGGGGASGPGGGRSGSGRRVPSAVRAAGAGAGVGALTGFLGVGGGFLTVPALVALAGARMRTAVGTSLLVVTVNALAALLARAGTAAPVDWAVVGPFTGAAVLGALDGRRLAARLPAARLRMAFGYLLLAVAALMAADTAARLA
ncbi:TSUP family transporter [Streptomyces fradiae]|uniref:TSUP family transporter n=1 Tax=Streptomyces fradiae TaxID=1906 RepID=UPI00294212B4|nr:TSUP family transporter [Streptomyces fradiae]WOI60667.1 TSUP family transporter [Streptomyces fradiae]